MITGLQSMNNMDDVSIPVPWPLILCETNRRKNVMGGRKITTLTSTYKIADESDYGANSTFCISLRMRAYAMVYIAGGIMARKQIFNNKKGKHK